MSSGRAPPPAAAEVLLVEQAHRLGRQRVERLVDVRVEVARARPSPTVPSAPFTTNARSMIRIVPASTNSLRAGTISPLNWFPGNATIMYSTGPIPIRLPPFRSCVLAAGTTRQARNYLTNHREPFHPGRVDVPGRHALRTFRRAARSATLMAPAADERGSQT